MYQHLNSFFTPFDLPYDKSEIVDIKRVQENIDVVINNLDDFYATMVKDAKLTNVRVNLSDPKDTQFFEDATFHEMAMRKDEMGDQEPIPELPEQEGLMARPEIGV